MPKTEQELIDKLAEADKDWLDAKRKLADAKKRWTEAETQLVDASIHKDRVKEELRVHRATTPRHELTHRDLEIERFRLDNPEIVEFAKERDKPKEEE
jgi:hypothetical protein